MELTEEQEQQLIALLVACTPYESDFIYGFAIHLIDMLLALDDRARELIEVEELVVKALAYQGIKGA